MLAVERTGRTLTGADFLPMMSLPLESLGIRVGPVLTFVCCFTRIINYKLIETTTTFIIR